jgi:hypothetical protein
MKKLIFLTALFLLTGITFGQGLQKGNLIGTHVMQIDLKPGVTMEQFTDFCIKTYIPEAEKIEPGMKMYLVKGIRGEHKNSYGIIIIYESEQIRNKFNNDDGNPTDFQKSIIEKYKPLNEKLGKLCTFNTWFNDWIVQ